MIAVKNGDCKHSTGFKLVLNHGDYMFNMYVFFITEAALVKFAKINFRDYFLFLLITKSQTNMKQLEE